MMKKYALLIILLLISKWSIACPACEAQQPNILKGITHGAGPESNWDWVIVGITAVLVLVTLFYTIKWLLKPGESSETHIKRLFIDQ
ncbi:hypothetical protein Q0590_31565 [Rhodocytophaga aerolata]|uniref:Cbb3-type cytochrome c oxidase subunit CcoP N-terminal domain-containing protein n=1 Tax=Rhodocytophaga aerolata TaxID=455078 RepID=A0ABT8RFK3_9BACT|nr:hypothetical protein [Rhodocytophaga aerolata]MDO1450855.1 hypothetical protein [Rhodocytophaga aerolata]